MSVIDSLTNKAGRLAGEVQMSLKRARVEGERRLLQRQHRAALEELGLRAYELVRAGELPEDPLATEVAAVEGKLIEIEAKVTELEEARAAEADAQDADAADEDPSRAAFPMVGDPAEKNPPRPD